MRTNYISLDNVKKVPANFLYVFADEEKFLKYLDANSASIIRGKKANQNKIIAISANYYGQTTDAYYTAIRQAFIDIYGMTPAEALVTLANGGTVAGKNWAAGVYGIGALRRNNFVQDPTIMVDEATGQIKQNGKVVSSDSSAIYGRVGNNTVVISYSYTDAAGNTFTSQYRQAYKKYYAGQYSTPDGVKQNADGQEITNADSSTIWESIVTSLETFVNWLISLFTTKTSSDLLNPSNTLPAQSDAFTTETTNASGGLLLALAAAGLIIGGGVSKGKDKKNNK